MTTVTTYTTTTPNETITDIAFFVESTEDILSLIEANTTEPVEDNEWDILNTPKHQLKKAIIEAQPSSPWVWVKAVEILGYKLGWIYYNWSGYTKQTEFNIAEYQEYLDTYEGHDEAYTAQMMLNNGAYTEDMKTTLTIAAKYSTFGDMMADYS